MVPGLPSGVAGVLAVPLGIDPGTLAGLHPVSARAAQKGAARRINRRGRMGFRCRLSS
jgi:hypothetical protein